MVITCASHAQGHEFDPRPGYFLFLPRELVPEVLILCSAVIKSHVAVTTSSFVLLCWRPKRQQTLWKVRGSNDETLGVQKEIFEPRIELGTFSVLD